MAMLDTWRHSFWETLQIPTYTESLKHAARDGQLKPWTMTLTTVVVKACESVGWEAAAKWNPCRRLPKAGQEFLGIDVMAFLPVSQDPRRWPAPLAVFELENHYSDMRVCYSLWKVLCVRAELRLVFAYRRDWEEARALVGRLADDVIASHSIDERTMLRGKVTIVIGSRGEGETFPWGYFKFWELDPNSGRFEKV